MVLWPYKIMKIGPPVAASFLACIFLAPSRSPLMASGQTGQSPVPSQPGIVNRTEVPLQLPEIPDNGPTARQKKNLLKYRFETMKKDADQLSELASSLQKEIGKSNQNILSLDVLAKADKIEKLAKKIKENAKGY